MRKRGISSKDIIRSHRDVLVGMDFLTEEVLTLIRSETRRVNLAGCTPYPDQELARET